VSAKAGYAIPLGDGLTGASVTTFAEDHEGRITDGAIGASFGAVTPRIFGVGRIAMNTSFNNRYKNYLNARTFIGGEDRLRGYPTAFFFGKDTIFFNIEYRSRAIEILKAQIGGVLFFDAGDAASGFDMLRAKQSVGFGLRTLFPQVNRLVLRVDFAFPLKRGPFPETGSPVPVDPFGFFFAFDQAFSP
jgi:outer membrane protein assembly factor BamA